MASKGKVAYRRPNTAICKSPVSCSMATCGTPSTAIASNPLSSYFHRSIELAFRAQKSNLVSLTSSATGHKSYSAQLGAWP